MTDATSQTPNSGSESANGSSSSDWDSVGDSVAAGAPSDTSSGTALPGGNENQEIEISMVTMVFDTDDIETLLGVLSKYCVVSRSQDGCRNIDVGASTTVEGRFVVVEKWESMEAQQTHFNSPAMVEMAQACDGLLSRAPIIDLIEPISVHDLA